MGVSAFDRCYEAARAYSALGDAVHVMHLKHTRLGEMYEELRSCEAGDEEIMQAWCRLNDCYEASCIIFRLWEEARTEYEAEKEASWELLSDNEKMAVTRVIF